MPPLQPPEELPTPPKDPEEKGLTGGQKLGIAAVAAATYAALTEKKLPKSPGAIAKFGLKGLFGFGALNLTTGVGGHGNPKDDAAPQGKGVKQLARPAEVDPSIVAPFFDPQLRETFLVPAAQVPDFQAAGFQQLELPRALTLQELQIGVFKLGGAPTLVAGPHEIPKPEEVKRPATGRLQDIQGVLIPEGIGKLVALTRLNPADP